MSESDGEKAARSVALEQAYVHEVYEQCAEKTAQSRHWPRIYKFLEELEPGALVCDIGCGNGKYLSVNENVFKVGAERCKRLTDIAREKENEVLMCDNLALPFRDESFDAVLSIAVVHHFATTERRVNALKELARVLRIGGRLVISVWAMEQRHRKFESQDVLVPWPKAYYLNSESNTGCPGGKSSAGGMPCINELDPDRISKKYLLTSKRNGGRKCKSRSYWIDPIFTPSPSTSSLSSPNETCYSFFRRALQKLAGVKRGSGNRAWFLDNWQNSGSKNHRNYDSDEIGDVDDIPIELRRLEDDNVTLTKIPDALSVKSKSLGDILEIQRLDLVRSRSSIPGFSSTVTSELYLDEDSKTPSPSPTPPPPPPPPPLPPPSSASGGIIHARLTNDERLKNDDPEASTTSRTTGDSFARSFSSGNKPRLVKQKTHIPDDATVELSTKPQNTAIREIIDDATDKPKVESLMDRRRNVHKQSSMNEELMSMERLIERDRVRRNIMKQASLNEEIICKPTSTFGNFRDTILQSSNATKRFQLIKSGLTNRIKHTTTSMEKVSSLALKNGFVKILQGWTSSESPTYDDPTYSTNDENSVAENSDKNPTSMDKDLSPKINKIVQIGIGINGNSGNSSTIGKLENENLERRSSREDGSDSSKDSSLQSDTSVDSEDSFASVIYVPKQQQQTQRVDHQHHHHQQHQQIRINQQNTNHNHQNNNFPSLIDVTNVPIGCYQLRTTSAPPSPRIKHAPDGHGPRIKLISISPLFKQFPATSKSLPPPSPPRLSPRNLNPFNDPTPFFPPSAISSTDDTTTTTTNEPENDENSSGTKIPNPDQKFTSTNDENFRTNDPSTLIDGENIVSGQSDDSNDDVVEEKSLQTTLEDQKNSSIIVEASKSSTTNEETLEIEERVTDPSIIVAETIAPSNPIGNEISVDERSEKSSTESINDEDSRRTRLNQIKELLRQKPGFATRSVKSPFPLVRRASTAITGRSETIDARTLPRLLSLELYNPETDDLDSDSSGLSSPESVGSVISVISDERFTMKKDTTKTVEPEKIVEPEKSDGTRPKVENKADTTTTKATTTNEDVETSDLTSGTTSSDLAVSSTASNRLFEAAANVANTLQDTVGTAVVRLEPRQFRGRVYPQNDVDSIAKIVNDPNDRSYRSSNEFPDRRDSRITKISRTRETLDSMPEETNDRVDDQNDVNDEKIHENVINDIAKYCENAKFYDDTETTSDTDESTKTTISRVTKKLEPIVNDESVSSLPIFAEDRMDLLPGVNRLRTNCKYSQLVDNTIAWLRGATDHENDDYRDYTDNNVTTTIVNDNNHEIADDRSTIATLTNVNKKSRFKTDKTLRKSISEDIMDFVMVSKTGECISMAVAMDIDDDNPAIADKSVNANIDVDRENRGISSTIDHSNDTTTMENRADRETIAISVSEPDDRKTRTTNILRYGDSVESTEIDDSIGNSVSLSSDTSRTDSMRFCTREQRDGGSTASLGSTNHDYKTLRERRKYLYQKRSASEEIPSKNSGIITNDDDNNDRNDGISTIASASMRIRRNAERYASSLRGSNVSGNSSSQESLLSDRAGSGGGGGAITYHQYYHVFREGELDQLINKYVENLHIISSYYDHASWCIVAEKVQVWTI